MGAETWRTRVLEQVDDQASAMVGLLSDLVRRPSVSGSDEESAIVHRLAGLFDEDGLDTETWPIPLDEVSAAPDFPGMEVDRTEAWGLVGRLAGREDGPALMLNCHVDVVPPGDLAAWSTADPYSGRVAGGRVHGRGACDMKGGLVASIWALRALRRSGVPLRGSVLLAAVAGEEDGGLGSYDLMRRGWRADACVIPEPTGLDLVPANAGALTFRLRVPGHATHASRRTSGVSAIEKFWPVWRALADLERRRNASPREPFTRWDVPYPLSIGMVRAGDWASSVPDLLVAEGRIGVALGEPIAEARAALEETVARACAEDPWLADHPVVVQWWGGQFASGECPGSSDLPDRVRRAHRAVTDGAPQRTWGAPYGSDLRLLTGIGGIPTVHYGPGDAALAHSPDESVPIAELATCARTLALLALETCGT